MSLINYVSVALCLMSFSVSSLQLNQVAEDPLKRPVVYVKGNDAVKLMNIVNKQKVARARIQHRPPRVGDFEADVRNMFVKLQSFFFFSFFGRCEDKLKFLL